MPRVPHQSSELSSAPPSRHDNPFATCWTRPGALPYRFADHGSAAQLIAKLAEQNWRGAIIGAHGSGKSTLLETLKPALVAAGQQITSISLHDGERRLPKDLWEASPTPIARGTLNASSDLKRPSAAYQAPQLLVIDGYEQLSWVERWHLARKTRRRNIGLLVTAHSKTRFPTLVHLVPDRELIVELVADLCAEVSTSITRKDVAASHACHGSNVREIFFDLYDRHERGRRELRTRLSSAAY